MRQPRRSSLLRLAVAGLAAAALGGCADFEVLAPTPTPAAPLPSLPPIGFNHLYGNSPLAALDGFNFEHQLFAQLVYWEVGVRVEPQVAGYVDRTKPDRVAAARKKITGLVVALATERLHTILGMLAFTSDAGQQSYAEAVVDHFRALGYTNLTSATVIIFFTEQDEHALLTWSPSRGYRFTILDRNLKGSAFTGSQPALQTPLPLPT